MSVATRKNLSQSIRIYAAIVATRQTDRHWSVEKRLIIACRLPQWTSLYVCVCGLMYEMQGRKQNCLVNASQACGMPQVFAIAMESDGFLVSLAREVSACVRVLAFSIHNQGPIQFELYVSSILRKCTEHPWVHSHIYSAYVHIYCIYFCFT